MQIGIILDIESLGVGRFCLGPHRVPHPECDEDCDHPCSDGSHGDYGLIHPPDVPDGVESDAHTAGN